MVYDNLIICSITMFRSIGRDVVTLHTMISTHTYLVQVSELRFFALVSTWFFHHSGNCKKTYSRPGACEVFDREPSVRVLTSIMSIYIATSSRDILVSRSRRQPSESSHSVSAHGTLDR